MENEIKVATITITINRSPRLSLIPGYNYSTNVDGSFFIGVDIMPKDEAVMSSIMSDVRKALGGAK